MFVSNLFQGEPETQSVQLRIVQELNLSVERQVNHLIIKKRMFNTWNCCSQMMLLNGQKICKNLFLKIAKKECKNSVILQKQQKKDVMRVFIKIMNLLCIESSVMSKISLLLKSLFKIKCA